MKRRTAGLADLDPLPTLPTEAAQAGLDALLLAIAAGPSLYSDRYAVAKANNFDRLLFERMPVLCTGRTGLLRIARPGELAGLVVLGGDES